MEMKLFDSELKVMEALWKPANKKSSPKKDLTTDY